MGSGIFLKTKNREKSSASRWLFLQTRYVNSINDARSTANWTPIMMIIKGIDCSKRIALKISFTYAILSASWILFSDQLLLFLVHDPQKLTLLQSIKGWVFVIFTASVLFFLFHKEIQKKKLIELRLRKNEDRLKDTQQIASLGSWEIDTTNNKLWWSDETYRIFGFEIDKEIAFEIFLQTIHPEDKQKVIGLINEAVQDGSPLTLDYRILLPNGDIRYLHEESRNICNDSLGKVVKRIGSVQDITQQKKMEEERENIINKLEKSLEEINTLRSILPLCSFCKKVRDDNGYWEQVDVYIHKYLDTDISHSICPDCAKEHYSEFTNIPPKA